MIANIKKNIENIYSNLPNIPNNTIKDLSQYNPDDYSKYKRPKQMLPQLFKFLITRNK